MAEPFAFRRPARRPAALALVALALVFLAFLIFAVGAHPLIVTLVALLVAPAVWDVIRNAEATLEIDDTHLRWTSGARAGTARLDEIDEAVLATTLDFSQRASLHLPGAARMRIPPECLPPGRTLDAIFEARGIPHRRSLFSF